MEIGASPKSTISLNGELAVARVMGDGGGRRLRLRNSTASTKQGDTETWKANPELLSGPFYVEYDSTGAAQSIWIKSGTPIEIRRLIETIVGELQLVRPDTRKQQWTSTERDNIGQYAATYTQTAPGKIAKRKTAYTSAVPTVVGKSTPARISASTQQFEVGSDNTIRAANVSDVIEVEAIQLRSGFALTLDRYSLHDATDSAAPAMPSVGFERFEMGQASLGSPQEQDKTLVSNLTWEKVQQLLRGPAKAPERSELRQRLAAMLRLRPDLVGQVVQTVHSDPEIAKDLMGALVHAGSSESQDALAQIIADSTLATPLREYAAIYSAQVRKPSETLLKALWSEFSQQDSPIRQVSGYACGSLISTMGKASDDLSKELLEDLKARWAVAHDSGERFLLLGILGNSASVAALPVILRASHSTNVSERAQAVRAVRSIESPESNQVVRQAMGDPNLVVRQAALEAAKSLGVARFADALQIAVRKESNEASRLEILSLLSTCERSSKLTATFDWEAKHDKVERVRAFALRLRTATLGNQGGSTHQVFPQQNGTNVAN